VSHLVEVVVEVDSPGAEVSPQQCSVCREHGSYVQVTGPTHYQTHTSLPLVKVTHYVRHTG